MPLAAPYELMRRAIRLAMLGRGRVEPNPMVGCVIVRDERILGEGYHHRFGQPHAEREAIAACSESPAGGTAYVTLEPCCHTNKKTPPCVPALIEAGIRRVVVGCTDPNPAVAGEGIRQLRQAGVEVEVGLLEAECRQLNAAFFARVLHRRPYVTLKWAQSADGKVAGPGGARRQISNAASMQLVHGLRSRCDAILVGIGTALADDPMLTARVENAARQPLRVVLDSGLRLPLDAKLVRTAREVPVLVCCGGEAGQSARADELRQRGVQILTMDTTADQGPRVSLTEVLAALGQRDVTHLLVEGGPTVAWGFVEQNLADRAWVFHAPVRIDDATAPAAPLLSMPYSACATVGEDDHLVEYLNPRSDVYFALTPSADFPVPR